MENGTWTWTHEYFNDVNYFSFWLYEGDLQILVEGRDKSKIIAIFRNKLK